MISYWKTQWFNLLLGFINLGVAIRNLTQGDEFMCLCWTVTAFFWFNTAQADYNLERIRVLEKRVKELED